MLNGPQKGGFYALNGKLDGSTSWERLSELEESHPLETTEYAEANLLL